jgi:hypothetical protein
VWTKATVKPRRVALCALALLACTGAGCAPSSPRASHASPAVRVNERDFHITAPAELKSGAATLTVANSGPEAHELIVVRSDGNPLPLRSDGLTVDEDAILGRTAGALEPGTAGTQRTLELHLTPGRYEFFCNMSGHFLGGMHTAVTVT